MSNHFLWVIISTGFACTCVFACLVFISSMLYSCNIYSGIYIHACMHHIMYNDRDMATLCMYMCTSFLHVMCMHAVNSHWANLFMISSCLHDQWSLNNQMSSWVFNANINLLIAYVQWCVSHKLMFDDQIDVWTSEDTKIQIQQGVYWIQSQILHWK